MSPSVETYDLASLTLGLSYTRLDYVIARSPLFRLTTSLAYLNHKPSRFSYLHFQLLAQSESTYSRPALRP